MTRLPGGALLLVVGILFLWLAITGKLDRLWAGWQYVTNSSATLPATGTASATTTPASTPASVQSLVVPAAFNAAAMVNALAPTVSV